MLTLLKFATKELAQYKDATNTTTGSSTLELNAVETLTGLTPTQTSKEIGRDGETVLSESLLGSKCGKKIVAESSTS